MKDNFLSSSGDIDMTNNKIKNLGAPTTDNSATKSVANKFECGRY